VKARRLARALVSDIVAYFPDRQREGIQKGSLKVLFREEIKKSYEEYVEQVGKEFAESTSHFRDALNDILAGGMSIF
jgi:L-amino acid N-acyltransferase YncA